VEPNGKGSGHMVIADTRLAQRLRGIRYERLAGPTPQNAESFQHARHAAPFEAIVSMASLRGNHHELLFPQAVQVHTCRGRSYLGEHGKLCTRSRPPVHKTQEHACSCRLSDRGCDSGDNQLNTGLGFHTLTVDEVFRFNKCHTRFRDAGTDQSS
jgi:hypothetical protein